MKIGAAGSHIVHVATAATGGAGIAMGRQHAALLGAGIDSRIVIGQGATANDPRIAMAPNRRVAKWRRALRKAGIARETLDEFDEDVRGACTAAGSMTPSPDLFSAPYSDLAPEAHPSVQQARIINIHLTTRTVDWPRFFAAVQAPIVFTLHDQYHYLGAFHYEYDSAIHPWLVECETHCRQIKRHAILKHRLAVVGNSAWNTRRAIDSGFFEPGTVFHTIPYPLNTDAYRPRPKVETRVAFELPPASLVIGFGCDDLRDPRKGFDVLVDALAALPLPLRARVTLLSFGRDPSAETKIAVPVPWIHLGYLNADLLKSAVYSAMDLFIVPSRAEAFGQTVIEALACGTAVIAGNVGGLPEALDGGRCGRLFESGSPGALAQVIAELACDHEARSALAADGRAFVCARHAPAEIARRYQDVYAGLTKPTGNS